MTAREAASLIGRLAVWHSPDGALMFQVRITDVRTSFGNTHYLITPVAGGGEKWVMVDSVILDIEEL